ncbi:2-keto-4-pentenoate hydratase/2-oxohepta-3-ene-1,7-dioic acid hydratase in catechol pathway [Pararhizobium capsulatum DSM 1112]|uniref:2-keto-4-pentenoate hydratase/2-oxohepta-3-ene-1,7-dioic acid hydratase in catechol pathway n=1 Tax=Pararhizobium capsulatum DSM 1112 TaxID=1121113 RepID=A0ABU0BY55_9HYPH|nr:fumarylacetoacetate hydrolase family protein [Pararhizobium capsulatum]MDQ0322644.1 2-keto-4-pentenoate hydratase/2-oxohepta-3-ene-1,7-dioic acid hydratase in catechol pathway [Pararhizobium capsulatum DSM 1112]
MFLVRYDVDGAAALGVLKDGAVFAIAELVPDAPDDMIALMQAKGTLFSRLRDAIASGEARGLPVETVKLLSPVERPGKFICLGLNYLEHVKEGGRDVPEFPTLFLRVQTSLLPPDGEIVAPVVSDKLDFEAELLVVIGKSGHNIPEYKALEHVFGYSAFNDGSIRDYQRRTTQWTAGKNFDATGPFGPAIVTADALPPGASGLSIRSRLNGEIMQDGNTADMMFSVARIIADISEIMTLEPGDLIATGTPSGVGFARKPPIFMKAGDLIEIEIEGMPVLANRVVTA